MPLYKPYALSPSETRVLSAFARYPCLTSTQATAAVGYKDHSYTKKQLKRLTDAKYLVQTEIPDNRWGRPKSAWWVDNRGREYLAEAGYLTLPKRHHDPPHDELFYDHTTVITDTMLSLEQTFPPEQLHTLYHDLTLKHLVPAVIGNVKPQAVPDAWVRLMLPGNVAGTPLWIEVDNSGKETQEQWKMKVARIVGFIESGHYQAVFGVPYVTVAVIVRTGEARRDRMMLWTAEELKRLNRESWRANFRFTLHVVEPCPSLWVGENWYNLEDGTVGGLFT